MYSNEGSFAEGYAIGRDTANGNNGWGFGGDWSWWIIILLIFGWGGNGFGRGGFGGGCGSNCATQADLAAGFNNSAVLSNLNDIILGQQNIQGTLCQGFNGVNTAILQSNNALSAQFADCCCQTQRAIDGVNYNAAKNACDVQNTIHNSTRDIIDSQREGTSAILNFLTNEKISSLQAENAALTAQLSNNAQTRAIIDTLRPVAQPAYITCSPYQSAFGFGYNGCGCNTGCCG